MDRIEIRELTRSYKARSVAFSTLNNAGEGFDPTDDIEDWDLVHQAETTSDVSVYTYTDAEGDLWHVLVGTDGMGSDDSRWAVRVGEENTTMDTTTLTLLSRGGR